MFSIVLSNVLVTLFYLIPGFILRKMGKVKPEHLPTLSAILIYIGTPFLEISAFMHMEFSWTDVGNMGIFFAVTFAAQCLFMLTVRLILGRRRFEIPKSRLLVMSSVMGNVGFFGLPIISAILPDHPEVACYTTVFSLSMNILAFTVGVYCLTGDKNYISFKAAFLNPSVFGFVLALPFYLFGLKAYLPAALISAIDLLRGMTTPLCMFILGIRLASAAFREIWNKPIVYVTALCKLLLFPLFSYFLVSLFGVPDSLRWSVLILSGVPCASVILSLSELHGTEPDLAADCLFVTTLLSFLTMPLLTLVM
ncbi:MAG: AEC family transporter [Clostridia bacterium]|nr:AEC family transporter [Clostridia bacterium]MBR5364992.1 AEC family transporter [Clostridia bacterium]